MSDHQTCISAVSEPQSPQRHRQELLRRLDQLRVDYQEMHANPSKPLRYPSPPPTLEIVRIVHRARPVVIEGTDDAGCDFLTGKGKEKAWSDPATYTDLLGDAKVSIAVTTDGLADSVQTVDGQKVFVKPLNEPMDLSTFLSNLADTRSDEIVYLQSQDGNISRHPPRPDSEPELRALQPFIEPEVSWMRDALGERAEAVNLWVGSSRSVTSFHHDPFENIYHVLSGTKIFSLVSPIEGLWFDQRFYPQYTVQRSDTGHLAPGPDDQPTYPVPWVESLSPPPQSIPIEVEVRAGETLYLPAGWWHRVSQSPGEGGLAVAVNYWYPSDPDAQVTAYERLARRLAIQAGMHGVIPIPEDEEEEEDGAKTEYDYIWASGDESGEEWDPKDWGR